MQPIPIPFPPPPIPVPDQGGNTIVTPPPEGTSSSAVGVPVPTQTQTPQPPGAPVPTSTPPMPGWKEFLIWIAALGVLWLILSMLAETGNQRAAYSIAAVLLFGALFAMGPKAIENAKKLTE